MIGRVLVVLRTSDLCTLGVCTVVALVNAHEHVFDGRVGRDLVARPALDGHVRREVGRPRGLDVKLEAREGFECDLSTREVGATARRH